MFPFPIKLNHVFGKAHAKLLWHSSIPRISVGTGMWRLNSVHLWRGSTGFYRPLCSDSNQCMSFFPAVQHPWPLLIIHWFSLTKINHQPSTNSSITNQPPIHHHSKSFTTTISLQPSLTTINRHLSVPRRPHSLKSPSEFSDSCGWTSPCGGAVKELDKSAGKWTNIFFLAWKISSFGWKKSPGKMLADENSPSFLRVSSYFCL